MHKSVRTIYTISMDTKIKNYVGIAIIIALLTIAFGAIFCVGSYTKSVDLTNTRIFSSSGEGKAVAIPDIATISFSVVTQGGKNIQSLQTQNTEKANAAIAFLKENGVEAKDIKTSNYNVEPRYQYYNCSYSSFENGKVCPPSEIVGYTITQTADVKIRDFVKIGDILSGLVAKGANTVSQLQFGLDDPTKAQNEARSEAIRKAKEKAKVVAETAGFRLGKLISVDEGFNYPYMMRTMSEKDYGIGGGDIAPAPAIEPGSQEISITVTLRFAIE